MSQSSIQQVSPNSTALNAEHYQSFEMAKANDGILGGDDIAQIRSYAAYARAQAQAIHKTIAATSGIEDVAAIKEEATETAQTFAKVGIYADQRIGEILRELPKSKGNQYMSASSSTQEKAPTKEEAIKESGISKSQAYDLQAMAANPEVVEAVIAKAEQDGRVVSRSQVLKAIKERDEARKDAEEVSELYGKTVVQRDQAESERKRVERELRKASITQTNLEMEAESLRQQLAQRPDPEVIEREVEVVREVVPEDYESIKRDNERLNREYQEMWRKKRELDTKLDQANELLGEKGKTREAQRDIEYLTMQINKLLHQHGGKAWAFDQFYRVDEVTQQEFVKAITNLAAFSQNLMQLISDKNKLEA